MSTLSSSTAASAVDASAELRPLPIDGADTRPLVFAAGVAMTATVAIALRFWQIGATFESSDQVAMPYLIRHSFGVQWIIAHSYGPVPALFARIWAEVLAQLGLRMGEASYRLPIALLSLAQVALTFPLMRRLAVSRGRALLATACAAVLPVLVTDAHYPWAYLSTWLFTGTLALWATLAWLDDRRGWQLALAAIALLAHCLSNCYAMAMPLTLLVLWTVTFRSARHADRGQTTLRSAAAGFVAPCLIALTVIVLAWWWTGGGQIGHLLHKRSGASSAGDPGQLVRLPALFRNQFGYLFAVIAAMGLLSASRMIPQLLTAGAAGAWARGHVGRDPRASRVGLLAIWAGASLLPTILLADLDGIGYADAYFIEAAYAGALAGAWWLGRCHARLGSRPRLRAGLAAVTGLALAHMALGATSTCVPSSALKRCTGVRMGWGNIRPDSGIKAASWYVREHVPAEAVILTSHTRDGMEAPVAEFYTGRNVLAGYDIDEAHLAPLLAATHADADVIIVDAEQRDLVEPLDAFETVCTLRNRGREVRVIYARPELALPRLDSDVEELNRFYNRDYLPRHIPIALSAPNGFEAKFRRYQTVVAELRAAARNRTK